MKRGIALKSLMFLPLALAWMSSIVLAAPVMVEKNLFSPDRRPPSDQPVAAAPQPNQPGLPIKSIQLDGIFVRGDVKTALIRLKTPVPGQGRDPKGAKKPESPFKKVAEGGLVGDYKLSKIESRSITLEKDGQTYVVKLFEQGKVLPPIAPVPVQPMQPVPGAPSGVAQPPVPGMPGGVQESTDEGDNPLGARAIRRRMGSAPVPGMNPNDPRMAQQNPQFNANPNQQIPYPPGNPNFDPNSPARNVIPQEIPEEDLEVDIQSDEEQ